MVKNILILLILLSGITAAAQNAADFTCEDCSGVNHHLFAELDSGAVVVICWVMPCGGCVGPSFTASQVVKSFDSVYPGRVRMYLVDDFANNTCASLNSWASGNNITGITTFSDAAVKMSDYGTAGMPKVVVAGGKDHRVYYNANYSVDATALQDSITAALRDYSTGTDEHQMPAKCSVFPNPSSGNAVLEVFLDQPSDLSVKILNAMGQSVLSESYRRLPKGDNQVMLNTSVLSPGSYFIRLNYGKTSADLKLLISK